MDKRTEALEQLRHAEQVLLQRVDAASALTSTEAQIERLENESKKGVAYQQWYPTDNAEKMKKEIEKELQLKKNERLRALKLRTILGSAIPGGIAVIGFISTVSEWDAIIPIMFLLIPIITFPTLVVTAIVQRKRLSRAPLEWEQVHHFQFQTAQKKDEQNTQRNNQQKAILDEELRKRNEARIAELQPRIEKYQQDYDYYSEKVHALNFLSDVDMNLYTVRQLIQIIESHRADNLTSALLVYDEQQARKEVQRTQEDVLATQRAMAQQMAETEEIRREEQHLRDQAEAEHRRRMEELAQRQLSELSKQRDELAQQRKDNYDYQRINDLENAAYRHRMEELAKEQVEELERKRKADNDYRKYGRIENN